MLPIVVGLLAVTASLDFKGVPLGITVDEFRHRAHPDGQLAEVVCTGDKIMDVGGNAVDPPGVTIYEPALKAAGVRTCVWLGVNDRWGTPNVAGLKIVDSGYLNEYSFSFIPDPKDGVLRLYRFQGVTGSALADVAVQALTAKFGKSKTTISSVQNGFGSQFQQVTNAWANSTGLLMVVSPALSVNRMAIIMTDTRLSKALEDQIAARHAAVPNGI